MRYYFLFLILGMFALTVFVKEKCKQYSIKVAFIKSIASVFFILTALSASTIANKSLSHYTFCFFVIAGLAFGMLGDVWLDLKLVYTDDDNMHTYFGFISFLLGHICYMSGLIYCFGQGVQDIYIYLPVFIGLIAGVIVGKAGPLLKLDYGKFRWIVMIYGSILASMMFMSGSLALYYHFKNYTLNLMLIGGLLFFVSDFILSGTYFGVGKDKNIHIISNCVTYYWAQFIIATSLLFIR